MERPTAHTLLWKERAGIGPHRPALSWYLESDNIDIVSDSKDRRRSIPPAAKIKENSAEGLAVENDSHMASENLIKEAMSAIRKQRRFLKSRGWSDWQINVAYNEIADLF